MSIAEIPSQVESTRPDTPFNEVPVQKFWPPFEWPDEPVRAVNSSRTELGKLRGLIFAGTFCMLALLAWLLNPARIGDPGLYFGLTLAVLLRAVCRLFEWYNYWSIKIPPVAKPQQAWTVDVLTTACPGEPTGMIVRTLKAMTEIRYPHTNYLCDEDNDPYLKEICNKLGVVHITRTEKSHAKAGNINNALQWAGGDIAVVLDPDHEPAPYLLDRTLGYFEDPKVGFVQSVQGYRNQRDSFVAKAAAEQSYHFYGPNMMGMHGRGTTQAIGANCVFRRAALDSIGGHAPGLAEDMHTSMRLYAQGWKSVYVPEILTRGLVPSTLPAFYKQQLKWSCGVFDLLFQEYPELCRGFTFSQKIHFLLCPVIFLRGVIGMLEMLVPFACLVYGFVAWRATLSQIAFWFMPVLAISALIHIRVQRWLLEPRERGIHLAGGLLAIATWWVYLAGFVCALFRIRVPYIPTPKEGEATNAPGIIIPNLLAAAALTAAAVGGVYLDSSPTAIFMAGIALLNAFAMFYVSLAAQQRLIQGMQNRLEVLRSLFQPIRYTRRLVLNVYDRVLTRVREGHLVPAALMMGLFGICFILMPHPSRLVHAKDVRGSVQDVGGFYTGIDLGGLPIQQVNTQLNQVQRSLDFQFRMVSFDVPFQLSTEFPNETLQTLRRSGAVPMINWMPIDDLQPPLAASIQTSKSFSIAPVTSTIAKPAATMMKRIRDGNYDAMLQRFAHKTRLFGEPVMICFAPQADDPAAPAYTLGGNDETDFAEAYEHIAVIFREEGASNAGWVWTPSNIQNLADESPREAEFANWLGVPARASSISFRETFEKSRAKIANWHLPIMIELLGTCDDPKSSAWVHNAAEDIANLYPEIRSVLFKDESKKADVGSLRTELKNRFYSAGNVRVNAGVPLWFDLNPRLATSTCVTGSAGHFSLQLDGKPFYVKGVVYNPGHDWRDADLPLSRRELDQAFSAIHAMGGNTIRRYGANWSDRNIYNAAEENQLKVMYGFSLPLDIDYLTDESTKKACEADIISTVQKYRNHAGLLGWCVGNEVWGELKHKFSQPYLTEVRHAEVLFVERLSRRIKELDPDHPIFCAQESFDVSGAISDYAVAAPTVDVMCVNSYYEQEIAHLDQAVTQVDANRPYLVSEFGPDGYWDDRYNHRDTGNNLTEATAINKAWQYANRWREYVARNKGRDVGGIAYCWNDRYEGTATWFGMNDLEGQAKPACAALAEAWNNSDPNLYGSFSYAGPKITDVEYPTQPMQPGQSFIVHASITTCNSDKAQYIWSVSGPDFSTDGAKISSSDSGDVVTIELPKRPGIYRVQLAVKNREGLDEASVPVSVEAAAARSAIK